MRQIIHMREWRVIEINKMSLKQCIKFSARQVVTVNDVMQGVNDWMRADVLAGVWGKRVMPPAQPHFTQQRLRDLGASAANFSDKSVNDMNVLTRRQGDK